MKLSIKVGATSQTVNVFIQDATSTTGAGKTGLVFNTATITAYYALPLAASVAITLATLAAVTSAYSSGGFKEIDATHMPGWYRFDVPNAALASGRFVSIHFTGVTGMADLALEIELTGWDNQDAVHGGLSALPNAAAGANTGLPVVGTQVPNATAGAVNGLPVQGGAIPNANAGANTGLPVIGTQIPNATAGAAGGIPTCDANNSVKIQTAFKKNTSLSNFVFLMVDSTGAPKTGLTVTATRKIDAGAFGACDNAVVEIANGLYVINLSANDLNGTVITLRFTATGAKDTDLVLAMAP